MRVLLTLGLLVVVSGCEGPRQVRTHVHTESAIPLYCRISACDYEDHVGWVDSTGHPVRNKE